MLNILKWFRKKINKKQIKNSTNNMFIVSTVSQLNIICSFIHLYKCTNNVLIILYTKKNYKMPKAILNNVEPKLFDNVQLLQIPTNPNDIDRKKYFVFYKIYENIFKSYKVKQLYVFSFLRHYSILLSIAQNKQIRKNLIEEGTATYLPLMKNFQCDISITEKDKLRKYLNKKNCFSSFDTTYTMFPDLSKEAFLCNRNEFFSSHVSGLSVTNKIRSIVSRYDVTKNDYIYVSQRFIKDEALYKAVKNFIVNIANSVSGNIFIKLHPVETTDSDIYLFYKKLSTELKNVICIEESFSIEPFVYLTNPKGIIGISSTSLVYSSMLSKVSAFSIAPLLIKDESISTKNREMISFHYDIIKTISNDIEGVESYVEIKNHTSSRICYELNEVFIQKARINYKRKNYHMAVFLFEKACDYNYVLLDAIDILFYIVSLVRLQQYFKLNTNLFNLLTIRKDQLSVDDQLVLDDIKQNYTNWILSKKNEKEINNE